MTERRTASTDKAGGRWWPVLVIVALVGVKLWLLSAQSLTCFADAAVDDRLFVNLGWHLAHGDWLGPYDHRTLVKGPMYPIWLALVYWSGLPLLVCRHLLYTAACGLLLRALGPLRMASKFRVALFGVLLFNPMTWSCESLRVVREGIYPALTLLVLGCVTGLYLRRHESTRTLLNWSSGLGLSLAAFWLTREEGVWIIPALCVLLAPLYGSILRSSQPPRAVRCGALAVWVAVWAAGLFSVCSVNLVCYGVFCTVEYKQHDFLRAYGSLSRVRPARHQQYVPVARETRMRVYEVSPAFRELMPVLEGPLNDGYSQWGAGLKPDEEMAGGWFMWALRDAAQMTGHCGSGRHSADYFARLADEIDAACDCGALDCGPPRATMRPIWHDGDGALLARGFIRMLSYIAGFESCAPYSVESSGTAEGLQLFADMTRERVADDRDAAALATGDPVRAPVRFRTLQRIGSLYQLLGRAAGLLALFGWAGTGVLILRGRGDVPLFLVTTAFAAGLASRALVLALVDLASIPCFNGLYPCPAHPLLLGFVCLGLYSAWRGVVRGQSTVV